MTPRHYAAAFLLPIAIGAACNGRPPTTPTTPVRPGGVTLNGRVTDAATGGPIAGAAVAIDGTSGATTDDLGHFSVARVSVPGYGRYTYVSAEGYAADFRYIREPIQNVHLHRIERIVAGESKLVTIAPDDTLCVNNLQDTLGLGPDYLCRSVFVVAPADGAVTIEAVSTQDGAHPPLEVETVSGSTCCFARMGNPTTVPVSEGTVFVVNVEMVATSTSAQSFVVKTTPPLPR
jgi:hypothetical protein